MWKHLSVGAKECLAKLCPVADECYADKAKAAASSADVVIINHALLAQLMVIGDGVLDSVLGGGIYIVDECHEFESVLARTSGAEITANRVRRLLRRASTLLSNAEENERYIENAQNAAAALFAALPREGNPDRAIVRTGRVRTLIGELKIQIETVAARCNRRKDALRGTPAEATAGVVTRNAYTIADELGILLDFDPSVCVAWAEPSDRDASLHVAQFDVAALCSRRLLTAVGTTILTSATVTVSGLFDVPAERLGLTLLKGGTARPGHGFVTLKAETPFDYPRQGMLLLPEHMPDPKDRDEFREAATEVVCRLVAAAGGRTLSLHTGWEAVRHTARVLRERFPHLTVLAQEKGMPTAQLVHAFMSTPTAVLVGTRSFMTGISLPGDACTCVCLDRIPFPIPSDPIVAARTEAANRRGGDGFTEVSVSEACLTVNQAAGRLIRTVADRGVFALCDPRVAHPRVRYRDAVLASLPTFSVGTETSAVEWLRQISEEAGAAVAAEQAAVGEPEVVEDDLAAW
ncbi:hypothetical protein GS531_00615 [Rhodococcus hoagii]|nr:hypothetical protein [Prescottella equi]